MPLMTYPDAIAMYDNVHGNILKGQGRDAYDAIREACQVDDAGYRGRKAGRMGKRAGGTTEANETTTN